VYGLENKLQPPKKFSSYEVFPLKVVDNGKRDHFDLLLVTDNNNKHYTYISNFSRLLHKKLVMKVKLYPVNDSLRRLINRTLSIN